MHFLFSKIQKKQMREKKLYFSSLSTFVCTYDMHLGDAHENCSGAYFVMCIYLFFLFLDLLRFFLLLFLLAFSLASLHFVVCKLELWIILSGFCFCCVCLSGGSCDRLFGIYDFNMKTEKWLEHQIHDILKRQ